MKLPSIKRIVTEDFDAKDQPLIEKLGYIINAAFEGVTAVLNKGVNFDDNFVGMTRQLENVTVDNTGKPKVTLAFQSGIKTSITGIIVLRADPSDSSAFPTSQPFITFSDNAGTITILNITGLVSEQKYKLKILALS